MSKKTGFSQIIILGVLSVIIFAGSIFWFRYATQQTQNEAPSPLQTSVSPKTSVIPSVKPTPSPAKPIEVGVLSELPKELNACIKQKIGEKTFQEIISGQKELPQSIGMTLNACCIKSEIISSCAVFAEKTGIMTKAAIEFLKKISPYILSGKAPGKCASIEACKAYCENSKNLEECANFFYKIGVFPESFAEQVKKDAATLKESLDSSPIELRQCVETAVGGSSSLSEILAGTRIIPQNISEILNTCFQTYSENLAKQLNDYLAGLKKLFDASPASLRQCVETAVGGSSSLSEILAGTKAPPVNLGEAVDICVKFVENQFAEAEAFKAKLDYVLQNKLLELDQCLTAKLGTIDYEKIIAGQLAEPPGFQDAIKACVESLSQP